jgi:hypothetical protein
MQGAKAMMTRILFQLLLITLGLSFQLPPPRDAPAAPAQPVEPTLPKHVEAYEKEYQAELAKQKD